MSVPAADLVWNRACDGGGRNPRAGDSALAALLLCHGYAMNGGVFYAVDGLDGTELEKAADGYRFFGLEAVAALLDRAAKTPPADRIAMEPALDSEYARLASDSLLTERFTRRFRAHPELFAPM